jgi:hypothetical protein
MKLRIVATAGFGFLLGTWAYLDEWSYDRSWSLHGTMNDPFGLLVLMALAVLTGFLVARSWVLLALLCPIASLAYLQSTGHKGPDGIAPLTSPPGIFELIWFGLLLLMGIAASVLWSSIREWRSRRP